MLPPSPSPAQVAQLVAEVQRLQGAPLPRDLPSGTALPSAEQLVNSDVVITQHLVTFRTLSELVTMNRWGAAE